MKKILTLLTLLLTFAVNSFSEGKTVYLSAGPWADDGGHFAVWAWGGENPGQWVPMEYVENEFAVYKAVLPEGATGIAFARFYAATAVGDYAWEKGDTDCRPSHVTQDIELKSDVDLYKITAMGPMFRTAGAKSAMFEEAGLFAPAQWNWQDFSVTFATNKGWENVYAFVWKSNNGANFDDRLTVKEGDKIFRPKSNGTKITATLQDGVYTYSFKAEEAPAFIRFSNGKSGAAKEQTDNLEFVNGQAYVFNNPEYYLVGTMNDWTIAEQYKLEANPEAEGEYMITVTLEANAEFKVKSDADVWYPDGENTNFKIEAAGSYTVYFRPDASGGDDWYYNVIYVQKNAAPAAKTIYLDADQWQPNDGHFAVWAWEGSEFDITKGQWLTLEYVEGELAIYKATLPEGCTNVNFARFIKATPVGEYAWEKVGDVDNRPYQCTQDITLEDNVDLYRITAVGKMYRNLGKSENCEANGVFAPREWNWQEYTVTFKTNKPWSKVYAVIWGGGTETGNNYTNLTASTQDGLLVKRAKSPGWEITDTGNDGVYTFTFKAEAAPEMIRFSDGKGSKDAEFERTTDNLEFVNGQAYELMDPLYYYLVGSMNDWSLKKDFRLEANPEAEGEYMITLDLEANTELKVESNAGTWYPDGMGNNYVITRSSNYTVYFRPDGNEAWDNGFFYVQDNAAPVGKTIYLDADQWQPNDGHFAVWAWEGSEFDITKGQWLTLEYVEGELAIYKATLPEGCTNVNFARFIKATPVGEYAWEKVGDVDNRPYQCTQDITLEDNVDLYRITAVGKMYRNLGKSENCEANGVFAPREWNWQEYTVTFKTNKPWSKVYAVIWGGGTETGNNYTNLTASTQDGLLVKRAKSPGWEITDTGNDGVYTFTFKAEAAPEMIRFSDGKGSKDAEFERTTDNLEFVNGQAYELMDPLYYYLVGSMNDWSLKKDFRLEANPEAEGEYMITLDLEANAELKVESNERVWYPGDGTPNLTINDAGNYTVYFRPDASGGEDWFYNVLYVVSSGQGIKAIQSDLESGHVIYTLQGTRVYNVRKGGLYINNGKKVVVK